MTSELTLEVTDVKVTVVPLVFTRIDRCENQNCNAEIRKNPHRVVCSFRISGKLHTNGVGPFCEACAEALNSSLT